jgi:6-pyruvoyl-tetrahydropterin synthase
MSSNLLALCTGGKRWRNIFQQKLTATTEACHAVLDNGVQHTVHCSLLHGYSIGIKLIFESETLDDRNWVMDFGGLKAFKEWQ